MDYKARFRPLEVHGADGWTLLDARKGGQDVSNHRPQPSRGDPRT
jgi:hypothetical protein